MKSFEDQVAAFTARKLNALEYYSETGKGKGDLATLRRGVGKKPGEIPQLWALFLEDFPEELDQSKFTRQAAENAVYQALTLYAFHQQGKSPKTENMHRKGEKRRNSLGLAARKLAKNDEDMDRILTRLNCVIHADNLDEMSVHLRSLISLLRSSDIPLDYANLARDLFRYQYPAKRDQVRLDWARDFYAFPTQTQTEQEAKVEGENNED